MEETCGNCINFDDEGYHGCITGSCKCTGRDISRGNYACNKYSSKFCNTDKKEVK